MSYRCAHKLNLLQIKWLQMFSEKCGGVTFRLFFIFFPLLSQKIRRR